MDIDTLGTFTMSKAAFPALRAAKSSCIINISMTLHYGATWYQTHASAAKVCLPAKLFASMLLPFKSGEYKSFKKLRKTLDCHLSYWAVVG